MSQVVFDNEFLPKLEALYGTPDVLRRRRLVHEALSVLPGERVLDIGCGPGFYVAELADTVGSRGAVVGVDPSPHMLAAANRRAAGHRNVELLEGEATSLPIDDATFDAVVCVQVLEYVPDTAAALAEMARVLRPGGRVVIWDFDWSTVSMHSSDPELTERMLSAWDGHLVHPSLPRTLAGRLRNAGFADVRAEGHTFATSDATPDSYGGAVVTLIEDYVAEHEGIGEQKARQWGADLRRLGERGEFFFACIQFCFTATRPR